jgi:hypothetical protein
MSLYIRGTASASHALVVEPAAGARAAAPRLYEECQSVVIDFVVGLDP